MPHPARPMPNALPAPYLRKWRREPTKGWRSWVIVAALLDGFEVRGSRFEEPDVSAPNPGHRTPNLPSLIIGSGQDDLGDGALAVAAAAEGEQSRLHIGG